MTAVGDQDTRITLPGDPGYEAASAVFNLSAPARPAAAVTARGIDQICAAIRLAQATGLRVRVHTTGHASAAVRPMGHALLIRTELQEGVGIDSRRRIARIPAGARWGTVVEAATAHGLTLPHGSSPTVGAVGYLLRGGLSFYGRRVGLAVNSVRAVELVTADGQLRRVDSESDPELFWALRGGGGGFGVVTALEIEMFPAARVITGAAYWPIEHAPALLSAWRRWTLDAPWAATTSVRVMNLPVLPEVPPVLSAGPVLSVDGAVVGGIEDGEDPADMTEARLVAEDLLGPLRAIAEPVMDTWQETSAAAVLQAHMDPTDPVAFIGDHMLLSEIGEEGEAEFLRVVGKNSGSPFVLAGLRQLGGAYAVPHLDRGALNHLDACYSYAGSGVPAGEVTPEMLRGHRAKVRSALAPWDTERTAPSFVEDFGQPQGHLRPDQVYAADRVRARVDPEGLFRGDIAPNATAQP
jgi:FAD/FMN-containing dehydrogenase